MNLNDVEGGKRWKTVDNTFNWEHLVTSCSVYGDGTS